MEGAYPIVRETSRQICHTRAYFLLFAEGQPVVCAVNRHGDAAAGVQRAVKEGFGERVLEIALDGPFERPGAVDRIPSLLREEFARVVIEIQGNPVFAQARAQT